MAPPNPSDTGLMSPNQISLACVLRNAASDNDVVATAGGAVDNGTEEDAYVAFRNWISNSPDRMKPELAQLLYPVFTHLYLQLVLKNGKVEAQHFHAKHHGTFVGNAEFARLVFMLTSIQEPEDLSRDEITSAFYNSKYGVTLSQDTFSHLSRYLEGDSSVSPECCDPLRIARIFRAKIDLRVATNPHPGVCSKIESTNQVRVSKEEIRLKEEEADAEANINKTVNEDKLKVILNAVRDSGPSPLPSTCLYKIFNENVGTCCASVSKDAQVLATGNEDSSVEVWDLLPSEEHLNVPNPASQIPLGRGGESLEKDSVLELPSVKNRRILRGHSEPVYDVAFSPSSKDMLFSVSGDRTMRLWDQATGTNLVVYRGHTYPVWCLDIDRLGVNVVTGSMDRTAKLWQMERAYPLRIYSGHESDVDVVKFHPNCNYLATGSNDKTLRLWSHADAKMVRVLNGHQASIHALAFSPDGKWLASAGEDRVVRVWDLGSARTIKELKGHSDIVYSLVWHQNSKLLASSGMDGVVKLWEINPQHQHTALLPNGEIPIPELLASYPTTCSNITSLMYSPHNTLVAVGVAGGASSSSIAIMPPSAPKISHQSVLMAPHQQPGNPPGMVKIFMNGSSALATGNPQQMPQPRLF